MRFWIEQLNIPRPKTVQESENTDLRLEIRKCKSEFGLVTIHNFRAKILYSLDIPTFHVLPYGLLILSLTLIIFLKSININLCLTPRIELSVSIGKNLENVKHCTSMKMITITFHLALLISSQTLLLLPLWQQHNLFFS